MSKRYDLVVIGAGPAGLAAAALAPDAGLEVALLDEQQHPGGQIYRAVTRASGNRMNFLGADYGEGRSLAEAISRPGVNYIAGASVWELNGAREVFYSKDGRGHLLQAHSVIVATGALERPMPFPGWTLPGVMTAGAGQTLLKSSGLRPPEPLVIAGCGPLLFLLATQYLRAGVKIAAIVETVAPRSLLRAMTRFPMALRGHPYLRKGLGMMARIKSAGVPYYKGARFLRALGTERVEALRFKVRGNEKEIPCANLLLHLGVVPNVQISRALGIEHEWDGLQRCWRPRLDPWGQTGIEGIYIAGDGGGIVGAQAAVIQGRIAALHAAARRGRFGPERCREEAARERRGLGRHLAVRPFLDLLYAPPEEFLTPTDDTLVCRCEEVTAGAVREFVRLGCLGPNQTKSFGRPGMGPCQGRYCGLTVSEIIAAERGVPVEEVGYYRIRPPIKPVTLGELAAMELPADGAA